MKVNDYVRTKRGQIFKWENNMTTKEFALEVGYDGCYTYVDKDSIVKSSPNIIDLIEADDYVNGHRVEDLDDLGYFDLDNYTIKYDDIKSIVTKEQFSSMEYYL